MSDPTSFSDPPPVPSASDAIAVKRVCLLTGGGDAPGLNAVIRGFVRRADQLEGRRVGQRLIALNVLKVEVPAWVAGVDRIEDEVLRISRVDDGLREPHEAVEAGRAGVEAGEDDAAAGSGEDVPVGVDVDVAREQRDVVLPAYDLREDARQMSLGLITHAAKDAQEGKEDTKHEHD